MQIRSWLRNALSRLWRPVPVPTIPAWTEGNFDRWDDAEWGRAIRAMGRRMERTWGVYR